MDSNHKIVAPKWRHLGIERSATVTTKVQKPLLEDL